MPAVDVGTVRTLGSPDGRAILRGLPAYDEREVMRLIARGYTYREVAKDLVLSVKTVETHMSSVLRKLQLSNRRELTQWAAARRLI